MLDTLKKHLRDAVFVPPVDKDHREHVTYAVVFVPSGCDRRSLSIKALDSRTRELADRTFVTVEGRVLPCVSVKEKDNGAGKPKTLLLEVQEGFFTFIGQ